MSPAKRVHEEGADENEIVKVDDGKRSKVESCSILDFEEDDDPNEPEQDLSLFPSFITSDDYTGGAFTLCDFSDEESGHHHHDNLDYEDDGSLTLIPGMVVPPFLFDFTKNELANSDDKTVLATFLSREIREHSHLHDLFTPIGAVHRAKLAIAPTGTPGGYGFVTFVTKEDAEKAIKELNGHVHGWDGRTLKVDWADPKKRLSPPSDSSDDSSDESF
ncbi:eukaryotic translation initiation factor 3 subunit G-like [Trifolium pratense]|uniref:eukaryotic translation initiation factor 3 subunit G-like n=1 Tax=Trifolium pratense TaxID=57577 RepID=UPI001E6940CC|nr:eukaryotic translation initiation factor 3 subunit G-like [Trifolium pratense]